MKKEQLSLDLSLYPLKIAYKLIDLYRDKIDILVNPIPITDTKKLLLYFIDKEGGNNLRKLKGEFQNELLGYVARSLLFDKNKSIRDFILMRALYSGKIF